MALNWKDKRTIDLFVPLIIAGFAGFIAFRQKRKWQEFLIIVGVSFLFFWVLTTQVTKRLYNAAPREQPGADQNYDARPLAEAISNDIYCTLCLRNKALYNQLLALSNAQLVTVYNYWNNAFYSKDRETLPQAIANESAFFDSDFGALQKALALRFQSLNLS